MPDPTRLVVLVSGGGTTLQNLLDRSADGRLAARIVGVVSSKADAGGVGRAERAGVPVTVVERSRPHPPTPSPTRGGGAGQDPTPQPPPRVGVGGPEGLVGSAPPPRVGEGVGGWGPAVWAAVRSFSPDLVCLGGWLHLLPIPDDFRQRVLNIHPSLLPAFGGKGMYGHHVHRAVLDYGAKVSGCTVHFADDSYDTGPIVVQRAVPVLDGDDADALAARVFAAECEAFPEAIELVAAGRVTVAGRRAAVNRG